MRKRLVFRIHSTLAKRAWEGIEGSAGIDYTSKKHGLRENIFKQKEPTQKREAALWNEPCECVLKTHILVEQT